MAPRPWGSEPYDVPVGSAPGTQAWAPPAGPVVAELPSPVVVVGPAPRPAAVPRLRPPVAPVPRLAEPARWAALLSCAVFATLVLADGVVLAVRTRRAWTGEDVGPVLLGVVGALLLLAGALAVATWVATSLWLQRAVAVARSVDRVEVPYGPATAWLCWVVPGLSLALPAFVVRDAWAVGARGRPRYLAPRVLRWSVLWPAGLVLQTLVVLLYAPGAEVLWSLATVLTAVVLGLALRAWVDVLDGLTQAWERPRDVWSPDRPPQAARIGRYAG